jgi:DNA-binding CsgD family transcriptional regulator
VQGEDRALLTQLVADPSARVLRPASLSRAAVGNWLKGFFEEDVDAVFVDACHATTRGNPLLLAELLREVAARGLGPTAAAAPAIPTMASRGLSAVVLLRLASMPVGSRALAQAVAVLGDGVDLWSAAALAELDDVDAAVALDALVRGGLLDGDTNGLGFAHPLMRSAILRDLGPADLSEAHGRAARLLQARRASPDEVASHLLAARPAADAAVVDVLREAARNASAVGAPDTAATYLRRALDEPPRDDDLGELCLELGCTAARAGAADAERHLRRAIELAPSTAFRCRAAFELARWLRFAGRGVEAVDILEPALAEAGGLDGRLADALEGEYLSLGFIGAAARRLVHDRLELELDDRCDDLAVLGLAARAFDAAASGAEPAVAAAGLASRAIAVGMAPADPVAGGYWCLLAGVASMWCDRFDLAERLMDSMLAEARRQGSAVGLRIACSTRALLHVRRGALPDAEADARFAISMADDRARADGLLTSAHATLALVQYEGGASPERIQRLITELEDPCLDSDALPYELVLHTRGCLRAAIGDDRGGLEDLLAGGRFSLGWGQKNPAVVPWRSEAALVASRLEEHDLARKLAGEELEIARRFGAPRAIGIALRAQALVAADTTTEPLLRDAVDVLDGCDARLELARALVDLGAVVRREGRRTHAREMLRRGLELTARCGAQRLSARAQDELLATGARPRRVALSGVESLTPSERRIARLAAEGHTNRMIAQALFITETTVEGHLARAYDKLGVRSRTRLPDALGEALAAHTSRR